MKSQSGFTLIEMVVVIIILAIMAATAMPRFANLTGEARLSTLNGMQGALMSSRNLVRSKWLAALSANMVNVDMGGTFVSVVSSGRNLTAQGAPTANTSGIWASLDNPSGYSSAVNAVSGVMFWPTGVAVSRGCFIWYSAGNATLVTSSPAGSTLPADGCL